MKKKKNKNEILDRMIQSMESTRPDCPHFEECGGCYMRQLSYENQLAAKDGMIRELFSGVLGERLDEIYEGIIASPVILGYRNKMEFSFGNMQKDGPLTLGLHRRGSFYDIVPVAQCMIIDEDMRLIQKLTQEYFRENEISFFHKRTHEGYLRHLLIRKAAFTGEILVDLVTASWDESSGGTGICEDELLKGYASRLSLAAYNGTLVGILHTRNDSIADTITDEGTDILCGEGYFYEELLGLRFKITPFSFFQTNSAGAKTLYSKAREMLLSAFKDSDKSSDGTGTLFDLYSGTGTIAQLLSPVCKKVIGVEIVDEAVEAAKENAILNGIDNCSFVAGDVLKVIGELEDKPDCIILDPPRDGIHPKALPKILDFGVDNILYIACQPKSLARDLPFFSARGYTPVRMASVDMFPGTGHVEVVVLLSQQKPDDRIEVEIELDELDLTSAESKATYEEIKEYVLKEQGLKVSNLYISQVKRKCGIEVGMNYNLPKSEDSRQPQCPEEKEKAIRDALEHFGMI